MWSRIDELRQEAAKRLRVLEAEFGPDGLHLLCKAVWARALADAHVSILHGDRENAERLLDRALHVLEQAPALARRKELGLADIEALMLAG
jgi:hypothetical protein